MPTLADVERSHIERALRETGGDQTKAAKFLGIPRRTLVRKLSEGSVLQSCKAGHANGK